jgi:5-methylthioadenosine/S-adenosylhomocysteine deaminase
MLAVPSDMHILPRWIAPMAGDGELLEHHTLVMRDGRILDLLPNATAAERYAPRATTQHPTHLLMPGLVNARTRIGLLADQAAAPNLLAEAGLLGIANMLRSGVTTFCDIGYSPADAARTAGAQGMRALIGLPVARQPSGWAQSAGEYLTRALRLRDEYKGHPSISTAFAPLLELDDATLARMGTLAAELDAGVLISLHESQRDIEESLARHGLRPLARLDGLGLLTPAITAADAVHLEEAEIERARRAGIGVVLCLASSLMRAHGLPPIAALAEARAADAQSGEAGIRLGIGSDGEFCGSAQDLWTEIKLLALHARNCGARAVMSPGDVLRTATLGGAAVLGLDAEIGTLEAGKWADLCCVDLGTPAMQPPFDPLRQLVFCGGRDLVSDVWVAGRQLLSEGQFTRLDWPGLAARLKAQAAQRGDAT